MCNILNIAMTSTRLMLFKNVSNITNDFPSIVDNKQRHNSSTFDKGNRKYILSNRCCKKYCVCSICKLHRDIKVLMPWPEKINTELLYFFFLGSLVAWGPKERERKKTHQSAIYTEEELGMCICKLTQYGSVS